jgi:hypothetical protein
MRRMFTLSCLVAVIWLSAVESSVVAQFNGVQVNIDPFGNDIIADAANEPSIAVDPLNPNNIAIGWRQFDTIASNFRQAGVAHSTDGGQTWTASVLDPGQFRSDPVLDFDADGNFYYSSLAIINSEFQVGVFKSTNGGATWSNPVFAHGGDKQWIAVDRTSGMGRGNIYQHWNVQFSVVPDTSFTRSTDGGGSFQEPIAGPQSFMKWGQLDVGPNGTLYMAGADLNSNNGHLFSKSTNAQDPMQTPTFSSSQSLDLGGVTTGFGSVNPSGLMGQVSIASDHSYTDSRGNVYVLGSVDPPGPDPLDVMLTRSTDGGETWSSPVRVNNDAPGTNAFQWFGTMSVAPNGRIDVIWNDTRNDPTDSTSELFYSYSFDAGQTWLGNSALSDPFDQALGYPDQAKLGDYYDMTSDNTGASLAYAATFNGGQDVYYLRIDADILCDFDDDRLCTVGDINELLGEGPIAEGVDVTPGVNDQYDLNHDGLIDLEDRDQWLALAGSQNGLMSPYKLGDADLDGVVDGSDFIAWNENRFASTLRWDLANFNGDAVNDGLDFIEWNLNRFTSSDVVAVPEPTVSVAVLLVLGLIGIRAAPRQATLL